MQAAHRGGAGWTIVYVLVGTHLSSETFQRLVGASVRGYRCQGVTISPVSGLTHLSVMSPKPGVVGHLSHTLFILNFMIPQRLSKSGHISQISRLGEFILLSACHR